MNVIRGRKVDILYQLEKGTITMIPLLLSYCFLVVFVCLFVKWFHLSSFFLNGSDLYLLYQKNKAPIHVLIELYSVCLIRNGNCSWTLLEQLGFISSFWWGHLFRCSMLLFFALFFFVLCLVSPLLSLDCPFVIARSVFSKVYLNKYSL